MGVFGEKHTSLTREQKRQLIHQADTHKLRPTEVCDWVLSTWGLRIARVTVYSILHKQRASLMAGHKDLYNSIHNGHNEDDGQSPKYRTSSKRSKNPSSISRGDSPEYDPILSKHDDGAARWEGQLKRVREPASVELDRAMVQFLKSSEAVDVHGRRLNDAELQSHALRLAREIPSASRMRCSFGWLRHFKRRLGVRWLPDRTGRCRWVVEMDPSKSSNDDDNEDDFVGQDDFSSSANLGTTLNSAELLASDASVRNHATTSGRLCHSNFSSKRQGAIKLEQHEDKKKMAQSRGSQTQSEPSIDEIDGDESFHSSQESLGKDFDLISASASDRQNRSTSTPSVPYVSSMSHLQQSRRSLDLHNHHQQQQQQHRHYSFSESSSLSSLGQFSSQPLSLPTTSLSHPSHSTFLNLAPTSIPTSQPHVQSSSILDTFPSLFDSLPINNIPSSQLLLNNSLNIQSDASAAKLNPSSFGMTVDGGMRKIPSKNEAYEMLQSLLLYYEQDHHYIGEQQTLLLPRWIHQQRQVMHIPEPSDPKAAWMRQHQQTQTSPFSTPSSTSSTPSFTPHPLSSQSFSHPSYPQALTHRSESTCSSPPLSPLSAGSPTLASSTTSASSLGSAGTNGFRASNGNSNNNNGGNGCGADGSAGLDHFNVNSAFPSLTSSIEQQMFFAHHHALQQQFALQQQQTQQATTTPSYSFQQSQHHQ
ncbi:hypothetical protein BGZ46_010596 [Entomortierella lignicola]|nr:hypothetical protein BGZ46_010596 [Entomortierella lignicola]